MIWWLIVGLSLIIVPIVYTIISANRMPDPEFKDNKHTVWIGAGGERVEYNEQTGKYKMLWP